MARVSRGGNVMRKMKRNMILLLWLVITLSVSGIAGAERYDAQGVPLRLERVLVLSRHNLRAPLDSGMAVISRLTPHEWFRWTAASGELSLRGGTLETLMGQYYRQWLEQEGLIPRNYVPAENEVRFYANSYQRTIATTQYFSSGMLPIANVRVERHLALNEPDPVFLPGFNGVDDEFVARVMEEIDAAGGTRAIGESLAPEAALVAEVLDYPDSEAARESGLDYFPADDMETVFTGDYFAIRGSLRPAMRAADALVLQYYEESVAYKAAFGHRLTREDWRGISRLGYMGVNSYFDLPTLSTRFAQPLLMVMRDELAREGRKFTFLCGHDTNLASVLTALGAGDYELSDAVEAKTPIGGKLTVEKWVDPDGQAYAALSLVYQNTEQIRRCLPLDLDHPPAIVPLRLAGLTPAAEGLYRYSDLLARLDSVLAAP